MVIAVDSGVPIEIIGLIISVISGITIPIVFFIMHRHLKKADTTEDRATMATFNIGAMDKELNKINKTIESTNKHFDDKLDDMIEGIEKRDEKLRDEFSRVWERLEATSGDIKVHDYAIREIKRKVES